MVCFLREIELDAQKMHICLQVLSTIVVKFSAIEYQDYSTEFGFEDQALIYGRPVPSYMVGRGNKRTNNRTMHLDIKTIELQFIRVQ